MQSVSKKKASPRPPSSPPFWSKEFPICPRKNPKLSLWSSVCVCACFSWWMLESGGGAEVGVLLCLCENVAIVSSVCTAVYIVWDYRDHSYQLGETLQKDTSSDFRAPLRFILALIHALQRCWNWSVATSPDDQSTAVVGILEQYKINDKLGAISVPSPSAPIQKWFILNRQDTLLQGVTIWESFLLFYYNVKK